MTEEDMKYIRRNKFGTYRVTACIQGKYHALPGVKTLAEARIQRDELINRLARSKDEAIESKDLRAV